MLAIILLSIFALSIAPSLVALKIVPRSKPKLRYFSAVGLFALFVTPSFVAGGILAVPVPFGAVLFSAVVGLEPQLIPWTLQTWPVWHLVSFVSTVAVGALVFVRIWPNSSFKADASGAS